MATSRFVQGLVELANEHAVKRALATLNEFYTERCAFLADLNDSASTLGLVQTSRWSTEEANLVALDMVSFRTR